MFRTDLFPVPFTRILSGFTTSTTIVLPNVLRVDLTDPALGVHKITSHTTHRVVKPPGSDVDAWEAVFPQGSINPGNKTAPLGGFGFYLHGPTAFHKELAENSPNEVLMSYEVMFEDGWEWQKGGKLPGICMSASPCHCSAMLTARFASRWWDGRVCVRVHWWKTDGQVQVLQPPSDVEVREPSKSPLSVSHVPRQRESSRRAIRVPATSRSQHCDAPSRPPTLVSTSRLRILSRTRRLEVRG